jgi:hypothetical protein
MKLLSTIALLHVKIIINNDITIIYDSFSGFIPQRAWHRSFSFILLVSPGSVLSFQYF